MRRFVMGYKEDFINSIRPAAEEAYRQYRILPSLTIAQAILESDWGRKHISNNLFGMKWTAGCGFNPVKRMTTEYIGGKRIEKEAYFRSYANFAESLADHAKLLGTAKRYAPVLAANNYWEAAEAVYKAGYATDPKYPNKLNKIIEDNHLVDLDVAMKCSVIEVPEDTPPIPSACIGGISVPCMLVDGVMYIQAKPAAELLGMALRWDNITKILYMDRVNSREFHDLIE